MKQIIKNIADYYNCELITFKKFLDMCPSKDYGDDPRFDLGIWYNVKIENFEANVEKEPKEPETSVYQRRMAVPLPGDYVEACRNSIVYQLPIVFKYYKESFDDLLEDIVVEYLKEYGDPRYFVNLGNRKWMMANPEDFCIMEHKGNNALVCFDIARTKMYTVSRETEEEVKQLLAEWYKERDSERVDSEEN